MGFNIEICNATVATPGMVHYYADIPAAVPPIAVTGDTSWRAVYHD